MAKNNPSRQFLPTISTGILFFRTRRNSVFILLPRYRSDLNNFDDHDAVISCNAILQLCASNDFDVPRFFSMGALLRSMNPRPIRWRVLCRLQTNPREVEYLSTTLLASRVVPPSNWCRYKVRRCNRECKLSSFILIVPQ